MINDPKLEYHDKQHYVAIHTQVPIPFGKYLVPLWDEVSRWLKNLGIDQTGPAIDQGNCSTSCLT